MKIYDYIVIGAGSGTEFALAAANNNKKVAIIDESLPGGTCLNRGCIPTKIMLTSAEVAEYIKNSENFGIKVENIEFDWNKVKSKVDKIIKEWRDQLYDEFRNNENIDFYNAHAQFIDKNKIQIGNDIISGEIIILAIGNRPYIPTINNLENIQFLTSDNIFSMEKLPKSIIIIGGGYIGMEFASFFNAFNVKVTVLESSENLINNAEKEIKKVFNDYFSKRIEVFTLVEILKIEEKNNTKKVYFKKNNNEYFVEAEEILIAVGRIPNTDRINIKLADVNLNERGYIITNEFLQTSNEKIYAIGDCVGTPQFRHYAGYQANILIRNLLFNQKNKAEYNSVPSAIFTFPEIATVGMTFDEAINKNFDVEEKRINYFATSKGRALNFNGFAKAIVDKKSKKILGFHIIGPYASILIHEVLPIIKLGLPFSAIESTMHIHPALSEMINWMFLDE